MRARFLFRALKARYRDQRAELGVVLASLRPGDIAVDIGAHKGAYGFWLRRAVGPEGKVYAYEPQPRLAGYLRSVYAALGWKNVFVCDCALSDSAGTGQLHIPSEADSPGASLDPGVLSSGSSHQYECRVATLDAQMENAGRVSFLKVDVEGYELQVFRGGVRVLSRDRPVILFECERRHLRSHSMQDVFAFLERLGYQGKFFSPAGLLPLKDFDPAIHQKNDAGRFWDAYGYCNNFLFAINAVPGVAMP